MTDIYYFLLTEGFKIIYDSTKEISENNVEYTIKTYNVLYNFINVFKYETKEFVCNIDNELKTEERLIGAEIITEDKVVVRGYTIDNEPIFILDNKIEKPFVNCIHKGQEKMYNTNLIKELIEVTEMKITYLKIEGVETCTKY